MFNNFSKILVEGSAPAIIAEAASTLPTTPPGGASCSGGGFGSGGKAAREQRKGFSWNGNGQGAFLPKHLGVFEMNWQVADLAAVRLLSARSSYYTVDYTGLD